MWVDLIFRQLTKYISLFATIVFLTASARGDGITFGKAKVSSLTQNSETDVDLTISDSQMTIQGKKGSRIKTEIPYSAIQKMSYGQIKHHRILSGAAVMPISPGMGALIMASKSKTNYLIVDYVSGENREITGIAD